MSERNATPWFQAAAKRALDLVLAVPATLVTLPVILVLAVGSAIAYRANPLFVQDRIGRAGLPFRFVKLRSLPVGAPPDADKYTIAVIENNEWGRFLRRTHLDELPEIWLVVTGKMSLVGPRPEMPSLAAEYDVEFLRERTTVLPGCTGLWQISHGASKLIAEHPEFDLHYVRSSTLRLDVWVLLATVRVMLGRGEPIFLRTIPRWTGARPADHGAPM